MIVFPDPVLDLLDQGRISVRGLLRFEFGTGTYGFINSVQPLVYGGLSYVPGGIIQVSDFSDATGLTAQTFSITLAESKDDGLTPEVLQTIEAEDYRDRPVKIYDAQFHPDTGELLNVELIKRGYVDTIDHIVSLTTGYTLIMNCESRAIDYTRSNARTRGDQDQRRRKSTDGFFVNSSERGRITVYWGRDPITGKVAD